MRPGYAVMFNIGAGMIVLTREAAEAVLATYRTTSGWEMGRICRKMTQGELWRICEGGVLENYYYSADWYFDFALMQLGFASVGSLPAMATNVEVDVPALMGIRPVSEAQPAAGLDPSLFRIYQRNLCWAAQTIDAVGYCFDPTVDRFVVFPHQFASDAYRGEWKPRWQQSFGPFELQPNNAGDTLRWELVNGSCDVLLRASGENKHCRIIAAGSVNDFTHPGGGLVLRAHSRRRQAAPARTPTRSGPDPARNSIHRAATLVPRSVEVARPDGKAGAHPACAYGSRSAVRRRRLRQRASATSRSPAMKKVIVTTTINPPTKAIKLFDAMTDWELVVIGDLKTPPDYRLERGLYVDPDSQTKYDRVLSDATGWNCVQRRNFDLLLAYDMGAEIVVLIDDDNVPPPGWGEHLIVGREVETNYYETALPVFDPVGATNHGELWHRGYPLQLLPKQNYEAKTRRVVKADVQADFWNGDPDIDAICRMEHAPVCKFDDSFFPIAADKPAPFNSQNTFMTRRATQDYFRFPYIGRMDDIWGAYYLQAKGFSIVFSKASVYQARNIHDPVRDMRQEYLGYEHNLQLVEALAEDPEALLAFLPGRASWAFNLYKRHFPRVQHRDRQNAGKAAA